MGKVLALHTDKTKLSYSYKDVVSLLPEDLRRKITSDEKANRDTGHALLLWCLTQSTYFVAPSVASVLQFVIARTYGYAKQGELISVSQLVTGIFSTVTGQSIVAPAVKDKTTAYKALEILEKSGLITKTRITINSADVISFLAVEADAILSLTMTESDHKMLRVSKKYKDKNAGNTDTEDDFLVKKAFSRLSEKSDTRLSEKSDTEYINKEDRKKNSCSVPRNALRVTRKPREEGNAIDCKSSAKDAVAKAVARVTSKREEKAARAARASFPTLVELNALWQSVVIAAFGTCTVSGMTHKEYGIFKRVAKPHSLSCSWKTFFEWVVDNWGAINNESKEIAAFKKSKGDWSLKEEDRIFLGSEAPDIFMMSRNFGKLVKRYAQHSLNGRTVKVQESAEVIQLRKAAEEARKEAQLHKSLLKKVMAAPNVEPMRKERKPVKLVDPETDTFFDDIDSSLPEWK